MARVLIVEDDGALRYDLSSELSSWGHEVLVATDGSSGFLSIRDEYPDLVLCDIVMPKASGFDLLERLKLLGSDYEDICFLFISSRDGPEMIVEGIKADKLDITKYLLKGLPKFDPNHPDSFEQFMVPASPAANAVKPLGS